ncbi:hypothetical protein WJX81_000945 [Elliptochloris bilobata]|uniref:Uncharacterized protein n=1 Tax=Elliptochloris bilobata TaxID=381761 RepID=A0AAW1S1F5_9CHLO
MDKLLAQGRLAEAGCSRQAHHNMRCHGDEFVMATLVACGKLPLLVHELLVSEVWRERVYPHLEQHLAQCVDSVTAYLLLYHEAALANLLEAVLFHADAAAALDDAAALELADWACRRLLHLNTSAHAFASAPERSAKEMLEADASEELRLKRAEVDFGASLCGLTILRYLSEHIAVLPLGVPDRLVATHDAPLGLLALLDRPPWERRRAGGRGSNPDPNRREAPVPNSHPTLERFEGGQWCAVAPADRLQLVQPATQAWLALYNLVADPACRAKAPNSQARTDTLLRARRQLSDLLLDQVPVLRGLRRALDEMAAGITPNDAGRAALLLEQVPEMRQRLLARSDWAELAARQAAGALGADLRALTEARAISLLRSFEFMCELEPSVATREQKGPERRVSLQTWRGLGDGGFEPWADFDFSIDAARPPEPVELASPDAPELVARGLRYRLLPMETGGNSRPLPVQGRAVAVHAGRTAAALLELPSAATRDACAAELPAVVWLTLGLLASDGLALQVRLVRVERPPLRDRVAGAWFCYRPAGGAITLLHEPLSGGWKLV